MKTKKQIYQHEYYIKNKDKKRVYVIANRKPTTDLSREKQREYYEKNKERLRESYIKYYQKNSEKIKEYSRKWYELHKNEKREKRYKSSKEWYQKNKKKCFEYNKKYVLNRRKTDHVFRSIQSLRARMNNAVKKIKTGKCDNTMCLVGCSVHDFKKHIESLWKPEMSWENYGINGWHIDHIIPVSSFNLTINSEQGKCFHYTNLQPLWASENRKKSNKTISLDF